MNPIEEKCIMCNGKGKQQKFDNLLNKWINSNSNCNYCNGKGKRYYTLELWGTNFMYHKKYINQ